MAVRPQFVGGVVPVLSWLKTSSSANENQIKLRLVIENANSGTTLRHGLHRPLLRPHDELNPQVAGT